MSQTSPASASVGTADHLAPPGTYEIDAAHTSAEFVARHLMVTKVRGRFTRLSGSIEVAEQPEQSSVHVTIDAASVQTGDDRRDGHLRAAELLNTDQYPTIEFRSTGVARAGDAWSVAGDLTILGVTRPVELAVDFDGNFSDPWGGQRIGFSATTEIDREDWGLTWNQTLESGGVLVGKRIKIELNVSAVRR